MKRFGRFRKNDKQRVEPPGRVAPGSPQHQIASQLRHLARSVEDGQVTAMFTAWDGQVAGEITIHPDNHQLSFALSGRVGMLLQVYNANTAAKLAKEYQEQKARVEVATPAQVSAIEKSK